MNAVAKVFTTMFILKGIHLSRKMARLYILMALGYLDLHMIGKVEGKILRFVRRKESFNIMEYYF
tara:strand:+ start:77 stop:271 length:195 start_codon:yes stop_codon:yes gene_type:complete